MTDHPKDQKEIEPVDVFSFFREIGVLNQLSRALLEAKLPDGLQTIHFSLLNNLAKRGEDKVPSELAQAFQLPRSNMTDILIKLQKLGFVEFKTNPKDGRSKFVSITDAGRSFRQNAIQETLTPLETELSERFDIQSLSKVLPTLVKLREVMDDMRTG